MDIVSYILSKEYTDQRMQEQQLKTAKIEQELKNYKDTMAQVNINQAAKQQVSGYGFVSLPKNCAEGQISVTLKGLTATNLIKNGNFKDGTMYWASSDGSISVVNNKLQLEKTGADGLMFCYTSGYNLQGQENAKFYIALDIELDDYTKVDFVRFGFRYVPEYMIQVYPNSNAFKASAVIQTSTKPENGWGFYCGVYISVPLGFKMRINNVIMVNLTATFGAGNEPTKEECDKIFANWFDATKSTIGTIRLKSVGKNLFGATLENGGIFDGSGNNWETSDRFRTKEFIKVAGNTRYVISGIRAERVYFYDRNKNYIEFRAFPTSFMTPANCRYVRFRFLYSQNPDGLNTQNIQLERNGTATKYEPYRESNAYVIAKDEGNILELRSLPNGTKDEINVTDRKLIKRIGEKSNIANGMVIDFADMAEGGTYYAWNDDGETEAGVKGDTLGIDATTLIYQLAEPVEVPIQVSGTLVGYPSGTVYLEPYVPDAGIYDGGISVLHQDLPIKSLERISKIDYETGLETELDVSKAIIADDKLSFTHPDAQDGDILFFIYEYDRESTTGEITVEYYDSRYIVRDSVTGKFYKWNLVVANGQWDIQLTEV